MKIILTLLFLLLFSISFGQPSFSIKPVNKQLFSRDLVTNTAKVQFQGIVSGNGSETYILKRFKYNRGTDLDGSGANDIDIPLPTSGNFDFYDVIPAGLVNYRYQVYQVLANNNQMAVGADIAREVVAGDAIIIYGQSNAEAGAITGDANIYQDNFIRAVGSRDPNASADFSTWAIAEGSQGSDNSMGSIGQWALYMAYQIVNKNQMPVAILSFPLSGAQLWQLQRNDASSTDVLTAYGRLLTKVNNSGLKNSVRALFFFQGEGDADQNRSTSEYKQYFNWLYDDLKQDFIALDKIYMFQIKSGCGNAQPDYALKIQEAQKQLADDKPDIELISTNNISNYSDNCHYELEGYLQIGERGYDYVKKDFYQSTISANELSPYPKQAAKTGTNKITLQLTPSNADYSVDANFKNMIKLNGFGTYTVLAVSLSGSQLEIDYSKTGLDPVTISVFGMGGQNLPSLKNAGNVGLISFNDLLIDAALPINLAYWRVVTKNNLPEFSWEVMDNNLFQSFEIQISSEGRNWNGIASIIPKNGYKEQYTYLMNQNFQGQKYFRLEGKKVNGEIIYSHIIKYAENQTDKKPVVYPNPLKENSVLHYSSANTSKGKITLLSFEGKSLVSNNINIVRGDNFFPIPVTSDMKSGIYFVKLETEMSNFRIKVIY